MSNTWKTIKWIKNHNACIDNSPWEFSILYTIVPQSNIVLQPPMPYNLVFFHSFSPIFPVTKVMAEHTKILHYTVITYLVCLDSVYHLNYSVWVACPWLWFILLVLLCTKNLLLLPCLQEYKHREQQNLGFHMAHQDFHLKQRSISSCSKDTSLLHKDVHLWKFLSHTEVKGEITHKLKVHKQWNIHTSDL